MSKTQRQTEPDWEDAQAVGQYIGDLLIANPMEFYEDKPPYYSPLRTEARFDRDLMAAAFAEGLSQDAVVALIRACHSEDESIRLDAYRDTFSGRWKVCPSVIPHWHERRDVVDSRLWLPEWAAKWAQGKPF